MASSFSVHYTRWIDRHRRRILALSIALAAVGGYLALSLPVRSDFSYLLPPSKQSVEDLEILRTRVRTFGTVFIVVDGETPAATEAAAAELKPRLEALDPELVGSITDDDTSTRDYLWQNRFLFVPREELEEAVIALEDEIRAAKLAANPLFVDLQDPEPAAAEDRARKLDELTERLDEAERRYTGRSAYVSSDGKVHLFVVRTTHSSTDFERSGQLLEALDDVIKDVEAAFPGVSVGLTGDVVSSYYENATIMRGMVLAGVVTVTLILLLLLAFFRSVPAVAVSLWALGVAVVATFGLTRLLIGHLNVMTAFLVAIVAGNGINAALMLLARYGEEIASGHRGEVGLARAVAGAARGTFAASVAAGTAYAALSVTQFRGFRDFGIIAALGMVLCWIAAFTILPAGLCELRARGCLRVRVSPVIGAVLARLAPGRHRLTALVGLGGLAIAAVLTVAYVSSDPLERDWRNLRSESSEIEATRALDDRMRATVGRKFGEGLTSRFVVAVDRREDVAKVSEILRAAPESLIRSVATIDDLIPSHQGEKLSLLARLRELLDDDAITALDDDIRETAERARPPTDLQPITEAAIPEELVTPFREIDGSTGKLVLVAGAKHFRTWNVDDRVALATGVRALGLPEDALVGGQSFIIADILASMAEDGPLASVVALIGAALVVLIFVGARRYALVTFCSSTTGILGMIALCHLVGLKVNFLDLVALPITVGIGIDYSVNLAVRERQDGERGSRHLLGSTGGAVVLCSLTTIIGYGSLTFSQNGGIRSFGLAAILGELTCLVAALVLVPSILGWWRERAPRVIRAMGR